MCCMHLCWWVELLVVLSVQELRVRHVGSLNARPVALLLIRPCGSPDVQSAADALCVRPADVPPQESWARRCLPCCSVPRFFSVLVC
jgi:hypothetical protein